MRSVEAVAGMHCPVCKTGLALSNRADIEIDYCPTCRGVWLDRGELDKIIERSQAHAAAPPPPPPRAAPEAYRQDTRGGYRGSDDDDRYRYGKRKKSFLSELFD
jgi:Zn-finger nucleic acid-binding protein